MNMELFELAKNLKSISSQMRLWH